MNKIWKAKDENGASLLIAIVLIGVIVVVLAGVLYVLLSAGPGPDPMEPPSGRLSCDVQSPTCVNITFGEFSRTTAPMDIKVLITNESDVADTVELSFTNAPNASTVNMLATGGASASYTDMNYIGNAINAGDYLLVNGLDSHSTYTVLVYHYETEALCLLYGDTTFTLD